MQKILIPATATALISAALSPAQAATAKEPDKASREVFPRYNVLCVTCEDISPYVGCFGDKVAKSPNLDAFSHEAIRYNMYTTVGVSAPSRFSLITGCYPSSYGADQMRVSTKFPQGGAPYQVVLPAGMKCYTEFLRAAGYYCTNNVKTDYQFNAPLTAWDECSNTAHWRNRPDKNMPFLSIFNLMVTHESQILGRTKLPLKVDPEKVILPPYYPDDPIVRHDVAVMYSNIYEMDRQTQALFDQLKEDGLWDKTIIIWYSDNGGPLPRGKREIYESGALIPFMIRLPDGYNKGEMEDRLVMFADIPPTILSLLGMEPPKYMQGSAFLGKYEAKPREFVYGAHDRMDEQVDKLACVRDARFRYIRNYMPEQAGYTPNAYRLQKIPMAGRMAELFAEGKLNEAQSKWFIAPRPVEEFYDVKADPFELNNLINDPAYVADIARLKKEYDHWINDYNQDWFLPEIEKRNQMWPKGIQPEVEMPKLRTTPNGIEAACATPGASLAYQIDGKGYGREKQWLLYTAPVKLAKGQTLAVVGVRIGYKNSRQVKITI